MCPQIDYNPNKFDPKSMENLIRFSSKLIPKTVKMKPKSSKIAPRRLLGGVLGPSWPQDGPKSEKELKK